MNTPRDRIEARLGLSGPPLQRLREAPPQVPGHEVVRRIGQGAYGEVWLARSTLGTWRAVKVVYRDHFKDARPYEREFAGIRRFEPLSRSNEGFVDILQVGRDDAEGWFYYVMELADDAAGTVPVEPGPASEAGSQVHSAAPPDPQRRPAPSASGLSDCQPRAPGDYRPKTLGSELHRQGRLPLEDCLQLGLTLTLALGHLHRHGLVHRDVKPANIIFVGGVPKLADIGLVTEIAGANTFVGTEGFVPPEGPGSPQADLFALGKVLYEASMGKDRNEFPEPYSRIGTDRESLALMELNAVLLRACSPDPKQRYTTAEEMHADLALLHSGGSVKRRHQFERQFVAARRAGALAAVLGLVIAGGWWWQKGQTDRMRRLASDNFRLATDKSALADANASLARESQQRLVELQSANGLRAMESGDAAAAALWFSEVLKQSAGDEAAERRERFRLGLLLRHLPRPVGRFHARHIPGAVGLTAGGTRLLAVSRETGSYSGEGEIRIWDLNLGRELGSIGLTNIWNIQISPSGRWAIVCDPRENRLFEVSDTWRPVGELPFGGTGARGVFSEDETRLALCGWNSGREVQILEVPSGRVLTPPLVHSDQVTCLAFDPAGRHLATGTRVLRTTSNPREPRREPTGRARVWEAATGTPIIDWFEVEEAVDFAAFSADGRALVILGERGMSNASGWTTHTATVLDVTSGRLRFPPLAHPNTVTAAAFSPDDRYLATACGDRTVTIWNAHSGRPIHPALVHAEAVFTLGFSPDGLRLAAGSDTQVALWDTRSGRRALPALRHDAPVSHLAFTPDGSRLLVAGSSGTLVLWDLAAAEPRLPPLLSSDRDAIHTLTFSPDRRRVVANEGAGRLQMWDAETGSRAGPRRVPKWETTLQEVGSQDRVAWSHDGRLLAAPGGDGTARIWEATDGRPLPAVLRHSNTVSWVEFSPVSQHLVTASQDGSARVWDAVSGQPTTPSLRHKDGVTMATYAPDGRTIATASVDQTARVWDAATGEPVTPPIRHDGPVYAVAFSPDGARLATAGGDHTARVWDARTAEGLGPPLSHLGLVIRVRWSQDGQRILTASADQTARVWDVRTGQPVTPPLAHQDWVITCAFSPDDSQVITGSHDGTARIWDAASGVPLAMPFLHRRAVLDASFSPDGRWATTASLDGTAQFWDLSPLDEPTEAIESFARLCAGRKLTPAGGVEPLDPVEADRLWQEVLRPRAADILGSVDDRILWHRRRLAESEAARDWHAVTFHVQHLNRILPDDPLPREALARAATHVPAPRTPGTPAELIDLSDFYNAALGAAWHGGDGNDLSGLPRGVQTFAGSRFDVRGLIQVAGSPAFGGFDFPREVGGIRIHRRIARLVFLHAAAGDPTVPDGTRVGHYVIHFASGRRERLDILYGRDVRDWHEHPDQPVDAVESVVAWTGTNPSVARVGTRGIRLFKRTWVNPAPEVEIATVDLAADHPTANPFLVALTAE